MFSRALFFKLANGEQNNNHCVEKCKCANHQFLWLQQDKLFKTVKKKFLVYVIPQITRSQADEMQKSREKYFSNGDSPPVTWQYFVGGNYT